MRSRFSRLLRLRCRFGSSIGSICLRLSLWDTRSNFRGRCSDRCAFSYNLFRFFRYCRYGIFNRYRRLSFSPGVVNSLRWWGSRSRFGPIL